MAAWGLGNFENDDAMDWVWELEHDTDGSALRSALQPLANGRDTGDPVEARVSRALAAAAVVARARGTSGEALPDEAEAWLSSHGYGVDDDILELAREAMKAVHYAIRDETGNEEWTEIVLRLANNLGLSWRPDLRAHS